MRAELGYEALRYLIDEVVFIHDGTRQVVFVSPSVESVLGYSEQEFVGLSTVVLIHPEDLAQAIATGMALHEEEGASYRSVLRLRHAQGHYVWCEIVGRNLLHTEIKGIVNTLRDISERRALEEQLHHHAFHDELTGLPNRRRFLEELDASIARCEGVGLGVLILDLDGLKPVNDRLGHLAGDELLRACAQRLSRALRDGDLAARLGGDEFGVICRRVSGAPALRGAAERIREAMRDAADPAAGSGHITVSVGARLGRRGDTSLELLRDADEALYTAKRAGRDRVVMAEPQAVDAC